MSIIADLLKYQDPKTGRRIKESAEIFNEADAFYLEHLLNTNILSVKQQAFLVTDLREDVAISNIYYYRLKAPENKTVIVFNADLSATYGPVSYDVVVGATSYTTGTDLTGYNLYTGGSSAESELEAGVVPTGGVTIPKNYIFGGSSHPLSNQPTASSSGLPTIIPAEYEIFAKITNLAGEVNDAIRFALAFAEVELPSELI